MGERLAAESVPIVCNNGSPAQAFRKTRRSSIDRLQPIHDVRAAMLKARARAVARSIKIDADPAFVSDPFENAMAGGKIDLAVAQIVNALEELRSRGILLLGLAVG